MLCRAAERIVGGQDKYIKWGPYYRLGVWGHGPRNFFFCGFTCSEVCSGGFWGSFSSLHTVHTYLPVAVFVSWFQIEKYDIRGPTQQLRSSQVCNIWSLRQQCKREAKKQAYLKSTMDLDWDENNEPDLVCSIVWGPPHTGGPGQTAPVAPPPPCRRHWCYDL